MAEHSVAGTFQPQLQLVATDVNRGATTSLLNKYAAHLKATRHSGSVPNQLWIAPHRLAAEAVRRELASLGRDAVLAPGIKALGRLSEAAISLDVEASSLLPGSATRWILQQAILQLHAESQLPVLAGVVGRSGLVDTVEQMLGELKMRGISAERFSKWAASNRRTTRDRELATVVHKYQAMLNQSGAADRFDLARLATECIARMPVEPRWDLVVVDGFASFAYYERQLLLEIARRARQTFISLPIDDAEGREELTSSARRTAQWLVDEWPQLERERAADTLRRTASLEHLASQLFVPPGEGDEPSSEVAATLDHVQVITGADVVDEAVQVARRIKQLLNRGVSPDAVVVTAASLDAHRRRLEAVFDTMGIPAAFTAPQAVGEEPAIRAVEKLLALETDNWQYSRVTEVVSSGQLQLLAGECATPPWRTRRGAVEWLVQELEIANGRQNLLNDIERLTTAADEAAEAGVALTLRQAAALLAQEPLAQLGEATLGLPKSASPSEWARACERLAAQVALTLEPHSCPAWQQVREAAAWIERIARQIDAEPPCWSLREWHHQLNEWMTQLPLSAPLNEEGRVRVYPASTTRYVAAEHLFVVGMDEQAFSSAVGNGGLYSEQRYDQMVAADSAGRAVAATPPHERAMQAFHGVVQAARSSITFSYAALDDKGQTNPASPMLSDAVRTFGGLLVGELEKLPQISPLPPANELPCSLRDWRLLAVHEATECKSKQPKLLSALAHSQLAEPGNRGLLAALEATHYRARGDSFGPMEGLLSSQSARQWFVEQYGPQHQWSTSQLETYAKCPFQFLMKNVMRIEPLNNITLEVDYSRRGSLLHRVFSELHQRLDQLAADRLPSQFPREQFAEQLQGAIEIARGELANYGFQGVLDDLLAIEINKWARHYYEQHTEYDQRSQDFDTPMRPVHFELRFGKPGRHADDDESPDSSDEPYMFDLGDGEHLVLGGRIDRVDVGELAGVRVVQVIDYKSANNHRLNTEDLSSGTKLQPPLYALAAAQILSTPEQQVVPLRSGYWVLRDKGFADKNTHELYQLEAGQVAPTEDWKTTETDVRKRVREIVAGVRQGEFPMFNPDEDCTRTCDFRHVCRVAQTRSLNKVWPPPNEQEEPDA